MFKTLAPQFFFDRKKPHPFVVSEGITAETVAEKCTQVSQCFFLLFLARTAAQKSQKLQEMGPSP
jgi:hypothetical protein